MVVEDLEEEVAKYREVAPIQAEIEQLMAAKEPLEHEQVELISDHLEKGESPRDAQVQALQERIAELDRQIGELIRKHQSHFNKHWGEVMRAGNEESYFANQTERFACIYMAKLGDLLTYSPRTYFRAPRRPMAHELQMFA
jgi:hypothetical protein